MHTQEKTTHPLFFRPQMDWWLALVVVLYIILIGAGIPLFLWYSLVARPVAIAVAFILAFYIAYIIDLAFYSYYVLDDEGLHIMTHVRHTTFTYRAMRSLQPGGFMALISIFNRKRFALSRKNVIIKLAEGTWRVISVSPADQDAFVHNLLERIDSERSGRAARVRRSHKKA